MEFRDKNGDVIPCGECGAPATHAARDIIRRPTMSCGYEYSPAGPERYGCDEHLVDSMTYEMSFPREMSLAPMFGCCGDGEDEDDDDFDDEDEDL